MFKRLRGVSLTRVGYMGGTAANPTYESVCSGKGGHSEALKVVFDPATISFEQLLKTSGGRAGNLESETPSTRVEKARKIPRRACCRFFENHPYQYESKVQYMSAIFYQSEAQKAKAEEVIAGLKARGFKVATKLLPVAPARVHLPDARRGGVRAGD